MTNAHTTHEAPNTTPKMDSLPPPFASPSHLQARAAVFPPTSQAYFSIQQAVPNAISSTKTSVIYLTGLFFYPTSSSKCNILYKDKYPLLFGCSDYFLTLVGIRQPFA